MKKGLLLGSVGILTILGNTKIQAGCIPTNDCSSLGYKYTKDECSGQGIACPFDAAKYNCENPCTYKVSLSDCSSKCLNNGTKSCTRNGTTYYESCGVSKCSSGYECQNGKCVTACTYTYSEYMCSQECKSPAGRSCTRNGITFYESCGNYKCPSGKKCYEGSCYTPVPVGEYCCGYENQCGYSGGTSSSFDSRCYSIYGQSCYQKCRSMGYPDCTDWIPSCYATGNSPQRKGCSSDGNATNYAISWYC